MCHYSSPSITVWTISCADEVITAINNIGEMVIQASAQQNTELQVTPYHHGSLQNSSDDFRR